MMILGDIYPMDADMKASISSLANFTVNLYAHLWFQALFPQNAAPLLLAFMEKVKKFERYYTFTKRGLTD